jgi:hypothetical protein
VLREAPCARNSCHSTRSARASLSKVCSTPGRRSLRSNCDAEAGCRHLNVVRRPLQHHTTVGPHHHHLGRGPGGWPNHPPRPTPTGGGITISRGLDRLMAPGRPALRASCDNPPRKIPYYRLRPVHFGH